MKDKALLEEKRIKRQNLINKIKRIFIGMNFNDGLIFKIFIWILLISFSYVYLYPLLFMASNSIKSVSDLIDPGVKWIPTKIEVDNYVKAWKVIGMPDVVFESTWYVLKLAIFSTITSALVGYGFATFNIPFKRTLMALMLVGFILPPQVLMVSIVGIYRKLGIMGTEYSMLVPAIFGQGINQSVFILIFYQFFKTFPKVLHESAEIDGATPLQIFYKITLPSAGPSMIIVFLFAFVWYWNETFVTALYTRSTPTIPLRIQQFKASYEAMFPPGTPGSELNEAIKLAGHLIGILPLLILYFVMQKHFTESIDRTGIAGE
ncbi:MAG TPA: carbohydrate ABC transporter permease [Acholeplasmataceae bacterium]|jgi:multiple sugar transport system permease protein|nr:carbohydrate ABC transporter permease [Acholeplasmataceae bacterium]HPX71797.1 carbohydrate ABC transporter permease [Acholeplasmataceae bacterium]HQC30601.1 carbohydrate ABC transporter permease [Acholeplasmataceae bacterium]